MGRFVNPDNSAFQVALNSPIYVDKTGLLEYTNSVLNTTEAYICNSRPRRFGKSYAANMLTAYYSKGCNSEEMFSGLDISRESDFKTHLNKYDVIHLDIQWFLANCDNAVSYTHLNSEEISKLNEIPIYFVCSEGKGGSRRDKQTQLKLSHFILFHIFYCVLFWSKLLQKMRLGKRNLRKWCRWRKFVVVNESLCATM